MAQRMSHVAMTVPRSRLEDPRTLYGGALVTFRVRFRLPLRIEVQSVRPAGAA
jgi:hypothetical protein